MSENVEASSDSSLLGTYGKPFAKRQKGVM